MSIRRLRRLLGQVRTVGGYMKIVVGSLTVTVLSLAVWAATSTGKHAWLPPVLVGTWLLLLNIVGTAVVRRAPRNPIGYLLCFSAVTIALGTSAQTYSQHIYLHGHSNLPLGPLAAWMSQWMTIPGFTLFAILFLRFPNGFLLSPRWAIVERLAMIGVIGGSAALAVRPGPLESIPSIDNPYAIDGLRRIGDLAETLGGTIFAILVLVAIASLVLRFRRSTGMERQQLKWFVFPVAVLPFIVALSQLAGRYDSSEEELSTFLIVMFGLLLIPVGMGIAMLKYRLYDIDVLINRTLVYGGLTLAVAAFYLTLVFVLQAVSPIETDSDLAVAASTLAAAALFRPLRSRIQRVIDRRFYRRKYDARRAVDEFSTRLRDEVDLEALTSELRSVLARTIQPAYATVWLKEATR